jgi:long-chain fatty acid transport protein
MMKHFLLRALGFLTVLVLFQSQAFSAGFRIPEVDTAAFSMSNTGVAGLNDAAAGFYNPALLTDLEGTRISLGSVFIHPSNDTTPIVGGVRLPTVSQKSHWFYPVHAHVTHRYNDQFAVGVSMTNPFGLGVEYPNNWVYREDNILADLKSFNFDLSMAFRPTDSFSVGVGLDYMRSTIKLIQGLPDLTAIGGAAAPSVFLSGLGSGWGGRAGFAYKVSEEISIGATYRSAINVDYTGTANFMGAPTALFPDQDVTTAIKMPDIAMIGIAWDNGTTRLEFDVDWTGWSTFDQLVINFAIGTPEGKQKVSLRNWSDVWAFRLGGEHHFDGFVLRAGAYYDQTPIPDTTLDALLPGADRYGVSAGIGFDLLGGKYGKVDVGYMHIFFKNRATSVNVNNVNADYSNSADLVGITYSYEM